MEKLIFNGSIFTLVQKDVQIHGKTYVRDIIKHNGGVAIIAIKNGKVALVKQFRHAIDQETYELPAGKLEEKEDPKTAALRELNEETHLETDRLEHVLSFVSTPGFCTEKIHIYKTNMLFETSTPLSQDEDEDVTLEWVDIDQAMNMIETGKIIDAKTIIGLQQAWIKRGEQA